jgi:chitinase
MIGINDITDEVFTQADAQKILTFAEQHGIDRISIWSLNRDYENSAGALNYVDNFSSSLVQKPLQFSQLLNQLTG